MKLRDDPASLSSGHDRYSVRIGSPLGAGPASSTTAVAEGDAGARVQASMVNCAVASLAGLAAAPCKAAVDLPGPRTSRVAELQGGMSVTRGRFLGWISAG